jgi:fructose-1-phosphate kinase PfkB-like protein
MGAKPAPTLVQFLGAGAEGDTVLGLLSNLQNGHVDTHFSIRTAARCRTCVTLVDGNTGEATEIIEPSGAVAADEQDRLIWRLKSSFEIEKAGGIAIMGTMPPGCPPTLYASILENAVDADSKVLSASRYTEIVNCFISAKEILSLFERQHQH